LATAAYGAVLHFVIAFSVAAIYYLAAKRLPVLVSKPVLFGMLFGAMVFLFMTYLILPFSAIPKAPFSLGLFLNGIIGHALFVGLPIALFAKRGDREDHK